MTELLSNLLAPGNISLQRVTNMIDVTVLGCTAGNARKTNGCICLSDKAMRAAEAKYAPPRTQLQPLNQSALYNMTDGELE